MPCTAGRVSYGSTSDIPPTVFAILHLFITIVGLYEICVFNSYYGDIDFWLINISSSRMHEVSTISSSTEIQVLLSSARALAKAGRFEKADRLYRHALKLNPWSQRALMAYGDFHNNHLYNPVMADHLYFRALVRRPTLEKAYRRRTEVKPLVEQLESAFLAYLDLLLARMYEVPKNHPNLTQLKHEQYSLHIYHSAAIEGNTMSLEDTRYLLDTGLATDHNFFEHQEIRGLDEALRFINETLVRRPGPLTFADILKIHLRVYGFVDPFGGGIVRTENVFIQKANPPPPGLPLQSAIQRFDRWLSVNTVLNQISLHPVVLSAVAHQKLTHIHPFVDGNGRTARAFLNLVLMRGGFPPIVIKVQHRDMYFRALEYANDGDLRPFIRFVGRRVQDTLEDYLTAAGIDPKGVEIVPSTTALSLFSGHPIELYNSLFDKVLNYVQ